MTNSRGPWWCVDNKASLLKTLSTTMICELCLTEYRLRRFSTDNTLNGHKRGKTLGLSNRQTLIQAIGYIDDEITETSKRGWWGMPEGSSREAATTPGPEGPGRRWHCWEEHTTTIRRKRGEANKPPGTCFHAEEVTSFLDKHTLPQWCLPEPYLLSPHTQENQSTCMFKTHI